MEPKSGLNLSKPKAHDSNTAGSHKCQKVAFFGLGGLLPVSNKQRKSRTLALSGSCAQLTQSCPVIGPTVPKRYPFHH